MASVEAHADARLVVHLRNDGRQLLKRGTELVGAPGHRLEQRRDGACLAVRAVQACGDAREALFARLRARPSGAVFFKKKERKKEKKKK